MKIDKKSKKSLIIHWQRLIFKGNTCQRCGSTESELDKAFLRLKAKLKPLGIKVILRKSSLTFQKFRNNPIESNRILFNNRSLEDLISARTGQSQCCDVCEGEKCRTLEIEKKSYEAVPADIIIKAGLIAVSKSFKN